MAAIAKQRGEQGSRRARGSTALRRDGFMAAAGVLLDALS